MKKSSDSNELSSPLLNIAAALALVLLLGSLGYSATYLGSISPKLWPDSMLFTHESISFNDYFRWWLGDMTEATFYKNELASIGMLAGALLAYYASRRSLKWQGFPISYGTGLFPWIILSSITGLTVSNILWGWTLSEVGKWQPTFVTFVSLPATFVLMFGKGWKVALLGGVIGALLVTPCALILVNFICVPLELPTVVGNVSGMAIGSIIAVFFLRKIPLLSCDETMQKDVPEEAKLVHEEDYGPKWTVRRILADFTESPFLGNEIASIGLILGIYVAAILNPSLPVYGSGLLVQVITAQALASAIGVVIWRKQWIKNGWYPTYIPVVSVAPAAVLMYGGTIPVIILSAAFGALIGPPLASAISEKLPKDMHPYIGNVISMAISTLLILPIVGFFKL
ncbi:UNVERIFIED_CONTAM: hypothetical protein I5919_13295 [Aeromonas hydrophila]